SPVVTSPCPRTPAPSWCRSTPEASPCRRFPRGCRRLGAPHLLQPVGGARKLWEADGAPEISLHPLGNRRTPGSAGHTIARSCPSQNGARRSFFRIFPVGFRGRAGTRSTDRGHLNLASRCSQN